MTNKFDQMENKFTYAERIAHDDWIQLVQSKIVLQGKNVADIGCGGGIYTRVMAEQGPTSVLGLDSSIRMLEAAEAKTSEKNISFAYADCEHLKPVSNQSLDIVLERAVIHHLSKLEMNFKEVSRVLSAEEAVFIVQDRTPEDCLLEGTSSHIRGYLFECFPFLAETEKQRRYSDLEVRAALADSGFNRVEMVPFWETRSIYDSFSELREDLQSRRGRTILHELSDTQINELVEYIYSRLPDNGQIIEKDRWSVWFGFRN
ncbi:class I SAM-dependent methyltransferase [Alkalicoccobacillus murimartini]|uniref:Ubiquinone/menaquinone biosynthesis C-methylase UbiE n=1 Tax=Alkalicoccobacillus murimartini TaxID=171685 RepID=A0ABT9YIE6_9BACI|nr:class I SAM-dependent methyltransferase [Alkalicoccobacillus murimartini]MDQ0207635.1 ubiquinone/menaquinone biosynthesis C-methylase UbiE [Alkalicoccobacillus murimartini]